MATESTISQVSSFYVAYYGRPADPAGLAYWAARVVEEGGFASVIDAFAESSEATARFGATSFEDRIAEIYTTVLGRAPDPEGQAFWLNQLQTQQKSMADSPWRSSKAPPAAMPRWSPPASKRPTSSPPMSRRTRSPITATRQPKPPRSSSPA